jgi:hypothetical protein
VTKPEIKDYIAEDESLLQNGKDTILLIASTVKKVIDAFPNLKLDQEELYIYVCAKRTAWQTFKSIINFDFADFPYLKISGCAKSKRAIIEVAGDSFHALAKLVADGLAVHTEFEEIQIVSEGDSR